MLTTTAAGQVHEAVAMITATLAKTVLYLNDVLLFEESDRRILQLSDLKNCLLCTSSAHRDSLLSACGTHARLCRGSHARRLGEAHFLAIDKFFLTNSLLKLIFGDANTITAEAVVN